MIVQGPVGDPPFELPDIQKIVSNFVFLKYGHLRETSKLDFQIYTELAKNLLHCINCWDFEAPRDRKDPMSTEEASSYKINYTRWLIFCWVPGKKFLVFIEVILKITFFSSILLEPPSIQNIEYFRKNLSQRYLRFRVKSYAVKIPH